MSSVGVVPNASRASTAGDGEREAFKTESGGNEHGIADTF